MSCNIPEKRIQPRPFAGLRIHTKYNATQCLTPQLCRRRAGVIALENQFTIRTRRPLAMFVGRAANITAHVLLKRPTVKRLRPPSSCPFVRWSRTPRTSQIPCFKVLRIVLRVPLPPGDFRRLGWQRFLNLISAQLALNARQRPYNDRYTFA